MESGIKGTASISLLISGRDFDQSIMDMPNMVPKVKKLEEYTAAYLLNLLKVIPYVLHEL